MSDEGIYSLLAKAQAGMASPKKNGVGQVGPRKYAYATLDDVLDSIKPALNENGLFLTQRTAMGESCLFIQTLVGHGSETLLLDEEPYEYDPNPQEYGRRETYAKRYGLCKAFAIVGDEDTDGDVQAKAQPDPRWKTTGTTAKRQPEDKRKKMLARIAQLKAKLMERGLTEEGLDAYLPAHYKVDSIDKLTDEQLIDYGKQLAKTVEEQKEGKADVD